MTKNFIIERFSSEGTSDNSPAFERRVSRGKMSSPEGTAEISPVVSISGEGCFQNFRLNYEMFAFRFSQCLGRPFGTYRVFDLIPALKRRAIFGRPSGTWGTKCRGLDLIQTRPGFARIQKRFLKISGINPTNNVRRIPSGAFLTTP